MRFVLEGSGAATVVDGQHCDMLPGDPQSLDELLEQMQDQMQQMGQEAQKLAQAGVKELLVISQDTSAYGVDVKYRTGFWDGKPVKTRMFDLVAQLGEIAKPYGAWVRLHYVYPYPHVDEVIPLMAEGLVLPYLDIPFQHGSPRILKLMKRPASAENNLERIRAWRRLCPDLTIRSTFIAGFPGETEADAALLLRYVRLLGQRPDGDRNFRQPMAPDRTFTP